MQEVKRRARLEVAFNFFLVLEEIRFHQLAELQHKPLNSHLKVIDKLRLFCFV